MADYLYSIVIQANSFHNNMVNKMVWRINEYSLYSINEDKSSTTPLLHIGCITQPKAVHCPSSKVQNVHSDMIHRNSIMQCLLEAMYVWELL